MKAYQIALAAVGGALVGAAAALLMAPQKGSDTVSQIKDFVREHCPGIKDKSVVDKIAEEIAEEVEKVEKKKK